MAPRAQVLEGGDPVAGDIARKTLALLRRADQLPEAVVVIDDQDVSGLTNHSCPLHERIVLPEIDDHADY